MITDTKQSVLLKKDVQKLGNFNTKYRDWVGVADGQCFNDLDGLIASTQNFTCLISDDV